MKEDRFAGSTDVPLSDEGRAQVEALAKPLSRDTLDAVYARPMSRTIETARIIATPHGFVQKLDLALREIDNGSRTHRSRDELESEYAEQHDAWQEGPRTIAPEGGESVIQVLVGSLPVLRRIVWGHRRRALSSKAYHAGGRHRVDRRRTGCVIPFATDIHSVTSGVKGVAGVTPTALFSAFRLRSGTLPLGRPSLLRAYTPDPTIAFRRRAPHYHSRTIPEPVGKAVGKSRCGATPRALRGNARK